MENNMEEYIKRFWHLLEFLKYILECKACIPFTKRDEDIHCPYEKPSFTDTFYNKTVDLTNFINDEPDAQLELENSVKMFHSYRKTAEKVSEANMILSRVLGGQITLSTAFFKSFIRCTNVKSEWTVKEDQSFTKRIDNSDIFKLYGDKGVIGCECGTVLSCKLSAENSYVSIDTYAYPKQNETSAIVISLLESTIKVNNPKEVVEALEAKMDIIPKIPLQHCF